MSLELLIFFCIENYTGDNPQDNIDNQTTNTNDNNNSADNTTHTSNNHNHSPTRQMLL